MKPALCCPACRQELMVTLVDRHTGLEIDSCSRCFGLWFDGNELSALFPSRTLATRVLHEHFDPGLTPENEDGRCCPRCQTLLRKARAEEVTLDLCPRCKGIWFDQGEIQRLVEASRKGLRGDREVVEQVVLGRALEGIAGLSRPQDPLGALLERLGQAR